MLGRDNRLTEKKDFENIKANGKMLQSESFGLNFFYSETDRPSRFGFIISTAISKDATTRNKAKRALREGARQNIAFIKKGYDCVFLAKPVIVKKYTGDLIHEVRDALEKAGII